MNNQTHGLLSRFRSELAQEGSQGNSTSLVVRSQLLDLPTCQTSRSVGLPSTSLLIQRKLVDGALSTDYSEQIEKAYADFGLPVSANYAKIGPICMQYAVIPGYIEKTVRGETVKRRVKVSALTKLEEDLALALACQLRLTKPNSKPYLALEIPRPDPQMVSLYQVLSSQELSQIELADGLGLALGLSVTGSPVVADLTSGPHLLIAAATNYGK